MEIKQEKLADCCANCGQCVQVNGYLWQCLKNDSYMDLLTMFRSHCDKWVEK